MQKINLRSNQASILTIPLPQEEWQPRTFRHSLDICLKDSNAYGNTYFSRYFEWQGVCREQWFYQCIRSDMLQSEGVFITKYAHQDYVHETLPFQKVECELNTYNIRQCSFNLLFRFFVDGKCVSSGHQQIVFANHSKKITRLPQGVIEQIREFEVPEPGLRLPG